MKNNTGKIEFAGVKTTDLVTMHNELATELGAKTVNKWGGKRADLENRIRSMHEAALVARAAKTNAPKKARGLGIGARVKELLHGGTTDTNEILAIVRNEIPEANITDKCVRWYASKEKVKLTTARRKAA